MHLNSQLRTFSKALRSLHSLNDRMASPVTGTKTGPALSSQNKNPPISLKIGKITMEIGKQMNSNISRQWEIT